MVYKKMQGAGLLEIMIAILLSAIIVTEIFRYSYYLERALNFSAEKVESIEKNNVLFAWLVRDIEMAGYVGCVNAHSRESLMDNGHYLSATWLNANGGTLESQYMSPQQFLIMEKTSATEVIISGESELKNDDVVIIENCWEAETAKIKQVHSVNYGEKNRLEFYAPLSIENIENTYVAKLIRHSYFIKDSSGLYVRDQAGQSDEVLENIVSFTISSSKGKYSILVREINDDNAMVLNASTYNAS